MTHRGWKSGPSSQEASSPERVEVVLYVPKGTTAIYVDGYRYEVPEGKTKLELLQPVRPPGKTYRMMVSRMKGGTPIPVTFISGGLAEEYRL